MPDLDVPVLIVGGGGYGLSSSVFLSSLGVDHLLVERHRETSHLPKAHYLNQRTMEIFRQFGLADEIYRTGSPLENFGKVRWRTSLGGTGDLDARTFYTMDGFGGGELYARYLKDSPGPSGNLPQIRLEPLLRRHAEERGSGRVRFGHELLDLSQDSDRVTATVRDLANETTNPLPARRRRTRTPRPARITPGTARRSPRVSASAAGSRSPARWGAGHWQCGLHRVLDWLGATEYRHDL